MHRRAQRRTRHRIRPCPRASPPDCSPLPPALVTGLSRASCRDAGGLASRPPAISACARRTSRGCSRNRAGCCAPAGRSVFSDLVFDRPPTAAEDRALRALLYHSARELLTDGPGLFAAAGFQLGTVRDIQAQTLLTGQHVQAVYRQHAAQIRVRYGGRPGPGIARRIDRQVAQVAAAIRRCGSYPALSATAPSTPPTSLPAVHPSARTPAGSPAPLRLPSRGRAPPMA